MNVALTMQAALREALNSFASGPLKESATAVLNAVGYFSNRTLDVGSVARFLDRYKARGKLTERQRKLFANWQKVELVFQVRDEEIRQPSVDSERSGDGFDAGRIKSFLILAVELAEHPYNRTQLANMTRAVNRLFAMPVLLVFRCNSRFSLAVIHRRAHRRDDNRDVLERVTLVKDVDASRPHRAHLDILTDLALPRMVDERGVTSFDSLHRAWEDALDAEELNRRFYRELFKWYERALERCKFPDDGAGGGSQERQLIRLITRLLFIWFLKEKGLVPDDIFTEEFAAKAVKDHAPEATDYYRAVLQNLFFATLNTEINKREFSKGGNKVHRVFTKYRYKELLNDPDGFIDKLKKVPFVNGGLFDCLDDFQAVQKGGRRIDAFTDRIKTQGKDLHVPASILLHSEDGLFPLFGHFKFTVEENTPLDQEVALDPELLGRVFENFLAAYNPETRNTVRKATGSYYTPRRIVDYMVDEALVAVLTERVTPTDGDRARLEKGLRHLLDYEGAFDDPTDLFDPADVKAIVGTIANLHVLDPAAGSGAFPMGVLHKLTLALRRLDPKNEHWEQFQKDLAKDRAAAAFEVRSPPDREAELREISQTFEAYRDSDYGRKLYLIQNSIYGLDVQPVACQIARLRFFISLAVEQQPSQDASDNYGIRPLPNLETRIVAANALISLARPKQIELSEAEVLEHMIKLAHVREKHFNANARKDKQDLREDDAHCRGALARALEKGGYGHDEAQYVANWDPYSQSVAADWFDAQWMFGVTEGFDVVIGNPPYVRADFQDKQHQRTRLLLRLDREYETLWEKWDLFVPFMERSFKLLREGGVTSLIVSDAFGHAKYALKAREWFRHHARILRLDFYSNLKLFDAAVRNISYVFQRLDPHGNEPIRRLHKSEFGDVELLGTASQHELTERAFVPAELYKPPPGETVPLGDICYVSVGMVVHAHEKHAAGAFVLDDMVSDTKDDLHPKPFVEGKHLDRWLPAENRWLEWGTARAPDLFRRPTFPELYAVEEKLLSVRMSASEEDRARVVYDCRCLHHNHSVLAFVPWHSLRGVVNRSIRKQARYPAERLRSKFAHREKLEALSKRSHLKYILGVTNSRSALEFLTAHRRGNIDLYPDDWKKLPIPDVPKRQQQAVVRLVDKILAARGKDADADISNLEEQIDSEVRAHYGF